MDDRGITEADVQRRLASDAVERAVDHLDAELAGLIGPRLHIGLVDLHDVRAGGKQVTDFLVDRGGIVERHLPDGRVEVVLRLLGHREGAGDGDLDGLARMAAQELDVAHLHRTRPADATHDARHGIGMPAAVERGAVIVHVDPLERGRKAVRVTLPPHLAVGDDVQSGALLLVDRHQGRIVLRLVQPVGGHAPQLLRAHPRRKAIREPCAVDQPIGHGV